MPFISNRGERAPSRRPVAVLAVVVIYTVLGVLTYEGVTAPWSPQMTAWSGDPIPEDIVAEQRARELMGAVVFQNKNCRNCHALEGIGGQRGPDLTSVGTRLTRDQLIDQISNGTPGGGNMPAYGQQMKPAEMTARRRFSGELASGRSAAGSRPLVRLARNRRLVSDGRRSRIMKRHEPDARRVLAIVALRAVADRFALRERRPSICAAGCILRRRDPLRWSQGRLVAFWGGLAAVVLALASPIEPFASLFLQVHMVQHVLLMMVAPPLIWLGEPLFPMLRGLPRPVRIVLDRAAARDPAFA